MVPQFATRETNNSIDQPVASATVAEYERRAKFLVIAVGSQTRVAVESVKIAEIAAEIAVEVAAPVAATAAAFETSEHENGPDQPQAGDQSYAHEYLVLLDESFHEDIS
ncbi:hypothetical protein [Roseiconus lacunae]|uniref:Uncharacterized protein n=1 Tax=Roseiconus lacunae TaxID=2605694 RepID=A0ABT7PEL2_9BACT|nr:hypothetical protein [Roseiconus lacunae]MDM4014927.1 hypothetical protein [Roseiconus lacunae]